MALKNNTDFFRLKFLNSYDSYQEMLPLCVLRGCCCYVSMSTRSYDYFHHVWFRFGCSLAHLATYVLLPFRVIQKSANFVFVYEFPGEHLVDIRTSFHHRERCQKGCCFHLACESGSLCQVLQSFQTQMFCHCLCEPIFKTAVLSLIA